MEPWILACVLNLGTGERGARGGVGWVVPQSLVPSWVFFPAGGARGCRAGYSWIGGAGGAEWGTASGQLGSWVTSYAVGEKTLAFQGPI